MKDGYHVITLDDGCTFEGTFKDGNRIFGVKTYPNGGQYIGPYVNNKRHGKGIKIHADGTQHEVEYVHGEKI